MLQRDDKSQIVVKLFPCFILRSPDFSWRFHRDLFLGPSSRCSFQRWPLIQGQSPFDTCGGPSLVSLCSGRQPPCSEWHKNCLGLWPAPFSGTPPLSCSCPEITPRSPGSNKPYLFRS